MWIGAQLTKIMVSDLCAVPASDTQIIPCFGHFIQKGIISQVVVIGVVGVGWQLGLTQN